MNPFILLSNRLSKILGNICKILSYPFHFVFPKVRFTIPEFSKAKIQSKTESKITRTIWQTNYSNRSTLPVYLNYLFNRLMSLNYDYRYVSTEERAIFIKENAAPEVYESYMQLNDGAAQADLWRLVVLNAKGGIYLDIDANFVWPLGKILKDTDEAVYLKIKDMTHFTNYFIASKPNNPLLQKAIEIITDNIKRRDVTGGVYRMTGPLVLNTVLEGQDVTYRGHRDTCIQGSFTNEYFQYLDKHKGKWIHKKHSELLKDEDTNT